MAACSSWPRRSWATPGMSRQLSGAAGLSVCARDRGAAALLAAGLRDLWLDGELHSWCWPSPTSPAASGWVASSPPSATWYSWDRRCSRWSLRSRAGSAETTAPPAGFLIAWGLLEGFTIATAIRLLLTDPEGAEGLLYYRAAAVDGRRRGADRTGRSRIGCEINDSRCRTPRSARRQIH